jgi:uncharacterized C2H2 Zn-finger protein
MFIIIGTKLFVWGSTLTPGAFHCTRCGALTQFVEKNAMRFVTIFFFIPIIPISGKKNLIECPRCKTRFERR